MGALIGLVVLVLDVLAILEVVKRTLSTGMKALWIVLIVALPLVGLAVYFFAGRQSSASAV